MTFDELMAQVIGDEIASIDGRRSAFQQQAEALQRGRRRRALAALFVRIGTALDRDVIDRAASGAPSREEPEDTLAWSFR